MRRAGNLSSLLFCGLVVLFAEGASVRADQPETATVIVSAPDGPTLETRASIQQASESGIQYIALILENVGLIQDGELMQLIREELYRILEESGYAEGDITLIECPESCGAVSPDQAPLPP